MLIEKAVCMHEEDAGLLWKHVEYRTNHSEVRRSRRLVLSFIATVCLHGRGHPCLCFDACAGCENSPVNVAHACHLGTEGMLGAEALSYCCADRQLRVSPHGFTNFYPMLLACPPPRNHHVPSEFYLSMVHNAHNPLRLLAVSKAAA